MRTSVPALIVLLSGIFMFVGPAAGDEREQPGHIAVVGEGVSTLAPDMAVLDLTVTREANTARAALDANSEAMRDVLKAMRDAGIAERDLQTSSFAIQPRYSHSQAREEKPPKLIGYTARNSLQVRVRDLDKLGAIIDTSVSTGVNEGGNVSFGNDDPSAALESARRQAVENALAKAGSIADAAGIKLGKVLSINEQFMHPQPMMARESMVRSAAAAPVPMASGENSYSVRVNLRVEIDQ